MQKNENLILSNTHSFVFRWQGLANDTHTIKTADMNTNKLRHFPLLSEVFFWTFPFSFSGWETSGFFSGLEKREEVDNVVPVPHLIYSCPVPTARWPLLLAWALKADSDHMMPPSSCTVQGLRPKESQALRQGSLSPQLFMGAYKNGHEKCLPQVGTSLQKASLPGSKTQISASKFYASKNYGLSSIT